MHFEKYKFSKFIQCSSKIFWNNEFLRFHYNSFRYILENSQWPISHDRHHSYDGPFDPYDVVHIKYRTENHDNKFYSGLLLSYTECVTLDELFKRAAKMQSKSKRWGNDDNSDFLGSFSDMIVNIMVHGFQMGQMICIRPPQKSMSWRDLDDWPWLFLTGGRKWTADETDYPPLGRIPTTR